ncbi:MAG TPA: Ig-like domain-containing protein, partial [bacterium]|nr:Ig-like domain-containing protein [bacterium]
GIIEIRKNKEAWILLTEENRNINEQDVFFQTSEKSDLLITSDFFNFYTDGYTLFRILKQKTNEILIELYLGNIFLKGTIDKKKFIKVKAGENIILDFSEKFNVDIDFTIDKKLYLYQIEGAAFLNINRLQGPAVKRNIKQNELYLIDKENILKLDKSELRYRLKNITIKENKGLREFLINNNVFNAAINIDDTKQENLLASDRKEKINESKQDCQIVYFYPKPNEIVKSANPYGLVLFSNPMNTKSVEKSIFTIASGDKIITESLEGLRFMGYIELIWSQNNKMLTIIPNKRKLEPNKQYKLTLYANNGIDIFGNKLKVENYEGAIFYEK